MATDSATIWGKNINDAIDALGITAGSEITDAQREGIWAAVKTEDKVQLGKADVAPGTFIDSPGATGGLPITGFGGGIT